MICALWCFFYFLKQTNFERSVVGISIVSRPNVLEVVASLCVVSKSCMLKIIVF